MEGLRWLAELVAQKTKENQEMAIKKVPAKSTSEKRRQREQVLKQAAREGKVGAGASAAEPYEKIVDKAVKQVSGKPAKQIADGAAKQPDSDTRPGSRQRRKRTTRKTK